MSRVGDFVEGLLDGDWNRKKEGDVPIVEQISAKIRAWETGKTEYEKAQQIRGYTSLITIIWLRWIAPRQLVKLSHALSDEGFDVPRLDVERARRIWRPFSFLIAVLAWRASSAARASRPIRHSDFPPVDRDKKIKDAIRKANIRENP